jgi:hypothetical protein
VSFTVEVAVRLVDSDDDLHHVAEKMVITTDRLDAAVEEQVVADAKYMYRNVATYTSQRITGRRGD